MDKAADVETVDKLNACVMNDWMPENIGEAKVLEMQLRDGRNGIASLFFAPLSGIYEGMPVPRRLGQNITDYYGLADDEEFDKAQEEADRIALIAESELARGVSGNLPEGISFRIEAVDGGRIMTDFVEYFKGMGKRVAASERKPKSRGIKI